MGIPSTILCIPLAIQNFVLVTVLYIVTTSALKLSTLGQITDLSKSQFLEKSRVLSSVWSWGKIQRTVCATWMNKTVLPIF